MVERKAEKLFRRGVMSSEEREAVRATNGHNDVITRDFYLLNSRKDEQRNAHRFAQLLTGNQDADEDFPELESEEDEEEEEEEDGDTPAFKYQRLWGTDHPEKEKQGTGIRIVWSPAEIRYIGRFEKQLLAQTRTDKTSVEKVFKTFAAR